MCFGGGGKGWRRRAGGREGLGGPGSELGVAEGLQACCMRVKHFGGGETKSAGISP